MIVAIDGPAGAGKSSVTQLVARELGFSVLDTGAMYRAVAVRALQEGVPLEDGERVGAIARDEAIEFASDGQGADRVLIGGCDVTRDIRSSEADRAVSPASAHPAVRRALVAQQQRIGRSGDYVVEGRDIGTVVFPDAQVKVFLTASAKERARRRVAQNAQRGVGSTDFDEVLAGIVARDEYDSSREASPLRQAPDAVLVDSSELSVDAVVERICALVRERQGRAC